MNAWRNNNKPWFSEFNFYDAHEINYARDSSTEESIKRQLMVRLNSSKLFVVLIGEQTRYLYKFVKWEIEQALRLGLPIIAVNLNGFRMMDPNRCPPILSDQLAIHISFQQRIIEYALNYWENSHNQFVSQNKIGPSYYPTTAYNSLGLY